MFHRVRVGYAEVLSLQMHDLRASNGGDALEFGASQLDRAFSQLGMVVRNENGRIRVLNMDLNDGWHFRKFLGIRKLIRKLPHFAT